ncbi:MAG: peptidoglycan DD-metalloendopeptidase family protein [Deltaproteobacteria bacterium]|nr:peptidoglycan DD-metalloendopeptidase family protein [Deltaproteobacteria bacterium]
MKLTGHMASTLPGGIESLRGRTDREAVKAAAREMESVFAHQMIKAMRSASGGHAGVKGLGGDVYGSLFDMELARILAARGLGLQDLLLRGLGGKTSAVEESAGSPTAVKTISPPEASLPVHGIRREEAAESSKEDKEPIAPAEATVFFPIRNGGRLSSSFGPRKDPFTGGIAFHRGMDIAAPAGTAIYPLKAGTVTFSGREKGYGNVVVIDHGDGFVTKYAHNRVNRVEAGDRVGPDTILAEVGETGRSTGPHLHFEVLYEGKNLRPEAVLARAVKGQG